MAQHISWRLVAVRYGDGYADYYVDHAEFDTPYEVKLKNNHVYLTRIARNKVRISEAQETKTNME